MPAELWRNLGGTWVKAQRVGVRFGGAWRDATEVHYRAGGVWRQVFLGITPINVTISASANNQNIFSLAGSPGGLVAVSVTINSGVVIGSSTGAPALVTGTGWAAGSTITIYNNGTIQGAGGAAGAGGSANGTAGNPGGDALSLSWPVSIDNTSGNVWGGGGGGGGGAGGTHPLASLTVGGGGGGGAAGTVTGAAGAAGPTSTGTYVRRNAAAGNAASSTTWGGGSQGGWSQDTNIVATNYTNIVGGDGGRGGGPGEAGSVGGLASWQVWIFDSEVGARVLDTSGTINAGGAGGAAGFAARLNGNSLTWLGGNNSTQVKGAVA